MGLFNRTGTAIQAKFNKLLDKLEDPNANLDLSYEKMVDSLKDVKRALVDVVTEQKVLQNKINTVKKDIVEIEADAKACLRADKEDLAKQALQRKQGLLRQQEILEESLASISAKVEKLKSAESKLQQRINDFNIQKEVMKATYSAAKAQVNVAESISGVSKQMGNANDALRRSKERTEKMTAKAEALDTLIDEGILEDPLDNRDAVRRELDDVRHNDAVENELARMKAELEQ